jgi:putative ABC transport system permease protein
VVVEVALALMLLICAGLTIKSFWNLRQVNPGFSARNVLVLETELPTDSRYKTGPEQTQFFERVLNGVAALPGVRSAALTAAGPIDPRDQKVSFAIEGRPLPNGHLLPAFYGSTSEDYFATMGIPLLRGRFFTAQDRAGSQPVAIIDETLAQRYWPAGTPGAADPIGQRLRFGRSVAQVIGIVGAVRSNGLVRQAEPTLYTSYRQYPESHVSLLVRHPHPAELVNEVKRVIYSVDREQPVFNVRTMDAVMQGWRSPARFTLMALLVFAGVAILLAAIGIYGVISYSVAQRRGELGIRIALGAGAADVLRLVVGQGMLLAGIGVALGLIAASAASRVLASLLFGVSATDPAIFTVTAALLAAVALVASWLPARRAARIDPIASLRYQ